MHVVAVACLAALAAVADLGRSISSASALVAVLLVYEQSLVSEHDLSQVKRAFDLNGYVGILYFVATAASRSMSAERSDARAPHVRVRDYRRQRRALRDADDGGAAGAGLPSRGGRSPTTAGGCCTTSSARRRRSSRLREYLVETYGERRGSGTSGPEQQGSRRHHRQRQPRLRRRW